MIADCRVDLSMDVLKLLLQRYPKVLQYRSVPVTYRYQGTFSGTHVSVNALGMIVPFALESRCLWVSDAKPNQNET